MGKKNIVLVHGWGAESKKLEPLARNLKKLEWNALVVKLPGFELTAPKMVWGIDEYGEYIKRESRDFFDSERFFYFGHSFGGRIGIRLAAKKGKSLSGLILCSASGLSRGNVIKREVFSFLSKVGKVVFADLQVSDAFRNLLYKLAREHDYERTKGIMKDVFRKVIEQSVNDDLKGIKIPLLVFWGKKDRLTPFSDALYIKKEVPKAKLVSFVNDGHRLPYEKSAKIASEIDKWAQV